MRKYTKNNSNLAIVSYFYSNKIANLIISTTIFTTFSKDGLLKQIESLQFFFLSIIIIRRKYACSLLNRGRNL